MTAARGERGERLVRPPAHRWLWYALGGGLPARHRTWVLHDTTTDTWWLRHLARMAVQLSIPIVLVMVLLPASWQLRTAVAGGGVFLALIYGLAYMPETTENRVVKAGYPAGTATVLRERAAQGRENRDRERRRAATVKRAARYRDRSSG